MKEVCGTVLPNEPDIITGPNNCKFILRPVDHSKMKHYQMLVEGSSSSLPSLTTTSLLTSISRKRPATTDTSAEPLQSAFSKKSTNVLTSVKGMLSTSAENAIKAVNTRRNKPVNLLLKVTKGLPSMMNAGQMLDPRIILVTHPKILWSNGHKMIVSLLSFLVSKLIFPQKQLLPCTTLCTIVY